MTKLIAAFVFFGLTPLNVSAHERAHVHGLAEVSIAAEAGSRTAIVTFEASGDSILGTERKAKSAQEKAAEKRNLERLEKNLPAFVIFDPSLACLWKTKELKVDTHGKHADVEGTFEIVCQTPLEQGSVRVQLASAFPSLVGIKVQALIGPRQRSVTVDAKNSVATIKMGDDK